MDPRTGELYGSDGYGNARVHKYTADGKLLFSWGTSGIDPGEFNLPHSVCIDANGLIYVADRENHRIQIFNAEGKLETIWYNLHRPCGLHIDTGDPQLIYVGGLAPQFSFSEDYPNLGPCVGVYSPEGKRLARLGDPHWGETPGRFIAPHGIASDSKGNLYVGEVSVSFLGKKLDPPRPVPCFRKLVKAG